MTTQQKPDPDLVVVLGIGLGADEKAMLPTGARREQIEMSGDELDSLTAPLLERLNEMRSAGMDPGKIMGTLMVLTGQIIAQQGVLLDVTQSVEKALGPLVFGYHEAQKIMEGGAQH